MELKEGMYVRTNEGEISKIEWISFQSWEGINTVEAKFYLENKESLRYPRDNFKASSNIIDLIEIGDYVNGYRVVDIILTYFNGLDRREKPKRIGLKVTNGKFDYENYIEADEIKEIVTKEMFNSVKYEVE